MSKRAQERALLAQVTREIQVNLRHIEQVLDAFFRDPAQRAGLPALSKDIRQVAGALRMLGLDQAEGLLALCEAQIEAHATAAAPVAGADLELLAESLSCLGFYVEAVEQQRPQPERLIAPLLARRQGKAAAPEPAEAVEAAPEAVPTEPVEGVEEQEGAAEAAPAPAISAETKRLLATEDSALDAEFLDIYLTEADEVLDMVAGHRRLLAEDPGARDALRTVRRGFHTLKGSGRMVGLIELGEHAFTVERILNRLLEDEHPATRAVLAVIDAAEQSFRAWVGELRQHGRVQPDAHAMHAAIVALEAELPRDRESVLARPVPAAPPVAPAPPPPAEWKRRRNRRNRCSR